MPYCFFDMLKDKNSVGCNLLKQPTTSAIQPINHHKSFIPLNISPKAENQNRKSSEFYNFAVRNMRTPEQGCLIRK